MRQEVDSRDEVMHSDMSDWWFLDKKMQVIYRRRWIQRSQLPEKDDIYTD